MTVAPHMPFAANWMGSLSQMSFGVTVLIAIAIVEVLVVPPSTLQHFTVSSGSYVFGHNEGSFRCLYAVSFERSRNATPVLSAFFESLTPESRLLFFEIRQPFAIGSNVNSVMEG